MISLHVVPDGASLSVARTTDGWRMACATLPDVDAVFLDSFVRYEVALGAGRTAERWRDAFLTARRQVVLVSSSDGAATTSTPIAEARRLYGPAVSGGDEPAVAWTELVPDGWRLMAWQGGTARAVARSDHILRAPAIADAGDDLLVACEMETDEGTRTGVWSGSGTFVSAINGRKPVLESGPDGRGWLVVEQAGPHFIGLYLMRFEGLSCSGWNLVPQTDYCGLNPHVAWNGSDGTLWVAWESCPPFGANEYAGAHRELSLWQVPADERGWAPGPDTSYGVLRIPRTGFFDTYSDLNLPPIEPRVLFVDGAPAVAYRRFRFAGGKSFGWDTYLMTLARGMWQRPRRLSTAAGPPDMGHAVLADPDGLVAFLPCCDHVPIASFEDIAAGRRPGPPQAISNLRIEVWQLNADEDLGEPHIPPTEAGPYVIPPAFRDVAPAPPACPERPEDMELIWADLHAHSAYSKCMSANDGMPDDVLRYQRDTLGCRVLCLTEHVDLMRAPEFLHVVDRLEAEAGNACVPLYGVEWAMQPAHHTNFYAIDRDVFERLRFILVYETHVTRVYRRIHDELPAGSVVAIRHFHGINTGETGLAGSRFAETLDPALEPAMEAMQTRGNVMIESHRGLPLFPSNFLNHGARIGLVGGSDHSRAMGPNRFCLTGLWVPECTAQAVFDAIKARRTFGASNGKVAMWPTLADQPMGSAVHAEPPVRVRVAISSARTVRRAALLRDGDLLPWVEVGSTAATVELIDDSALPGDHWHVVTVEADSAYRRSPVLAHASPFFTTVR